jgi:predicted lactoylglutathione lyase
MAVEINPATDRLQIKHKSTAKWSDAITLLQLEEGFNVSFIDSQMQQIELITQAVGSLATLSSAQEIQKVLKEVDESLGKLFNQGATQSANVANFYQSVSATNAQLTQLAAAAEGTNQSIATQLTALAAAVSALRSSIAELGTTSDASSSIGEKEVFETLISITAPRQIQSCPLPNTTNSLVFSGRKDSLERSYDIYWSFTSGNLAQGKYKILWAYNEFQKAGLSFKDKTLYLSCDVPIQIDVCAYYS